MSSSMTARQPIDSPSRRRSSYPPVEVSLLPGGYVADGQVHREVELGPLTGVDEEFLAAADPATPAAVLTTALLAGCVRRLGTIGKPGLEVIRDLLVGDREFLLLKLRQLTLGDRIALQTACPRVECGALMDLVFSLRDFPVEERPASAEPYRLTAPDGVEILFRLPTGRDQEAFAQRADIGPGAADHLLARCVLRVGDQQNPTPDDIAALPEAARALIEERIERLAPEVTAEVETVCPECQRPFAQALELPRLFLAELQAGGGELEREIHFLALHYHWPEREILRMTRRKRRRYVALLSEELEIGSGA